jgi:hypothetical protein
VSHIKNIKARDISSILNAKNKNQSMQVSLLLVSFMAFLVQSAPISQYVVGKIGGFNPNPITAPRLPIPLPNPYPNSKV